MQNLKKLKQWFFWRRENDTKVPYSIQGHRASSTNSKHWSHYDSLKRHGINDFSGIGFVFTDKDDLVFIDMDHVLNSDGSFKESCFWAKELTGRLNSYTEISPSGDGLHIFVHGQLPTQIKNKTKFSDGSALEVYASGRYSTVTENVVNNQNTVNSVNLDILMEYAEARSDDNISMPSMPSMPSVMSDNDIVARLERERHWSVGTGEAGNSEEDARLVAHVAFWSGGDADQTERIVRTNGLYRKKWDSKRGGKSFIRYMIDDWMQSGKAEFYSGGAGGVATGDIPFSDLSSSEKKEVIKEEKKRSKKDKELAKVLAWATQNEVYLFFNKTTDHFCLRRNSGLEEYSRQSFTQVVYSESGGDLSGGALGIDSIHSDFRPDQDEFYIEEGRHYINTFRETKLMNRDGSVTGVVPHFIGLMLDSMFNGDEERNSFLNWLAYIYQFRTRTNTAYAFVGAAGSGKGVLVDTIIKGIFGHNIVANLTDQTLESQFNSLMRDRLFVHFNEISTDSKKSRLAVKNRLKTWITDDTILINEKGVKEYYVSNHANIIINSNEAIPVDIDADDRRFNIIYTKDTLISQSWFTGGGVTVGEMIMELPDFAAFLRGYDVDVKAVSICNTSEKKASLIEVSRVMSEDIAIAFKERDFNFFIDSGLQEWLKRDDDIFSLPIQDIEDEFNKEFISNSITSILVSAAYQKDMYPSTISKIIFSKYGVGEKTSKKINRKVIRGHIIKLPEIELINF